MLYQVTHSVSQHIWLMQDTVELKVWPTMTDLGFEHTTFWGIVKYWATTTTLPRACIDSITSNTKLMPLTGCIESVQSSCASRGGSVVEALSSSSDGHAFKSQHSLSKTQIQLSCIVLWATFNQFIM